MRKNRYETIISPPYLCITIQIDGPAVVYVNIFVRSISKIDDVVMVSEKHSKSKFVSFFEKEFPQSTS